MPNTTTRSMMRKTTCEQADSKTQRQRYLQGLVSKVGQTRALSYVQIESTS
jgi:hypothetical protein